MGGIPTNKFGEVVIDDKNTPFPGLYAAGECACVSVHGGNRLGTNSLLDLVVFGKHAGLRAAEYAARVEFENLPRDAEAAVRSELEALRQETGKENLFDISTEMKKVMFDLVGIYRNEKDMQTAIDKVHELQERYKHVKLMDTGKIFNTELINVWELGNMLELAEVIVVSALNRKESRGGHSREDYPKRDDKDWLKHTLITKQPDGIKIGYKPVTITKYQPKERVY